MRFTPSDEQLAFADAVDDIVISGGGLSVARSWAEGDHRPGLKVWRDLAASGVLGLRISEEEGGVGASASELVVVFERLGFHAVPGPYLESTVLLPTLVDATLREGIADGSVVATAAVTGTTPFAVDADASTHAFEVSGASIAAAASDTVLESLDPARRLARLRATAPAMPLDPTVVEAAIAETTLACAAMLVGAGERLLAEAVAYAKVREQFGRAIGEYQAVKHALADVRIALSFARPLVYGAALDLGTSTTARSVSAAKLAAGQAALKAAGTALQVHGAIGYTAEHDLGLVLLRVRALAGVWGTASDHRAVIARAILAS